MSSKSQEQEESSIEAIAIETYSNNLEYLQNHHPKIYEKLSAFNLAIEQNHYQNRYDLILKDGYFDVLELSSGNYLYSSDSYKYAEDASKSIDFEKDSNVFETFKKINIKEEQLDKYASVNIADNNLSGLAPIISFIDKNMPKSTTLEKIDKFIFFGTGLGTHIESIDSKISASTYLIIENDLELFKLSLFTCTYYKLASKSKLIFSIFSSGSEFNDDAFRFLNSSFYHNHYIKYFQMLSHSEDKLNLFHMKVASQTHNLFYYSEILKQYIRPLDYLKSGYNFLNLVQLNSNNNFTSKPVILLAAGPSLSKNIKWLKKNHNRFIIVALSATLSILEKNNITPDIVTHIDGRSAASIHFEKLNSLEFLKNTIFIISAKTENTVVNMLDKNNIFFFENGTSYKKDFGNVTAPCVGSTTYLLLLLFNLQEIYLLGLDMAIDSKTGSTHSDGHEYAKKLDLNSLDVNEDKLSYKNSLIKIAGNFQEEVYTTPEYKFSVESINSSSQNFKNNNQFVYNLNDGALFSSTLPTTTNSVDVKKLKAIDKIALKDSLYSIFTNSSSNVITSDEVKVLEGKQQHSLKIKKVILKQENSNFNFLESFLNSLVLIFEQLTSNTSVIGSDLSLVYENYIKFISTFVFDFFNTKGLQTKELYIKDMNRLLCKQFLRIVKVYENSLSVESVESIALKTYQKNLEYFSLQHPELKNKLTLLDKAIEDGRYKQKYDLDYIDTYFDVKELKSSKYLYSTDSNEISKELSKQVNFSKNSDSFEGFILYDFSDETLANLDEKSRCLDGVYPIMNHYIKHSKNDDLMKYIEKFIFIGVGLGLHISKIHKKIDAKNYLIIEDDIELFRLSLFTTSYFELGKNANLYFSINENENIFLQSISGFLENSFIDNRYLKYSYFGAHSVNKIKQIQNALATQSFMIFPYKTELEKFLRPLEYINNGYKVLNLSNNFENSLSKPALLITAGPSFKKNISWLKKNHKKFIIIAISATLKLLYKHNIIPDIVTHLDGFESSLVHYEGFNAKEFLKSTIMIIGPFSPSKLRNMLLKENIYFYEENTNYFEGFGSITAPCIGSFSLLLALKFNIKELYLLGLDLAVDQESGSTHSSGHAYIEKKDMGKKDELSNVISFKENLFPVEGNFKEKVYTSSLFHLSVQHLYRSIGQIKKDNQSIYNLNDGAKIDKAIPKHIEDLNVSLYEEIDKKQLNKSIHQILNVNSSIELSKNDVDSLRKRLENAKKVHESLLLYSKDVSYESTSIYFNSLMEIVSEVLMGSGRELDNLTHVYYLFFKYTLPIIADFLNTVDLANKTEHIKEFDKMIQKEMFVIEYMYEDALSNFIRKKR